MSILDAEKSKPLEGGPSFSFTNRIYRAVWWLSWKLLAAWTPPPLFGWRRLVLRAFGAKVHSTSRVYGSSVVWSPRNLVMEEYSLIGPRVNCYNMDLISIGAKSIVSQGVHLCGGSHDLKSANFQLFAMPITIGSNAWIAADAFVGPGVAVGVGAVVGARAVVFKDVDVNAIVVGNPAKLLRYRDQRVK